MADPFVVPRIDFSWLSQLPEQFAQGEQLGREDALRRAFSTGQFMAPDGTLDYAKMFQVASQAGSPDVAMRAAQMQAEQAYRSQMMKPEIQKDWEFLSRSQGGMAAGPSTVPTGTQPPPPGGGQQPITPTDVFKALHPQMGVDPKQMAVDKTFAKDYVQWTRGGKEESTAGLSTLDTAIKSLEKNKDAVSGPVIGAIVKNPNSKWALAARQFGIPGLATPEQVQEAFNNAQGHIRAIMVTLKPILGARFAQQLATMVVQSTYDPSEKWDINSRRLHTLYKNMEGAQKDMNEMSQWYEDHNNSLVGFKGHIPDIGDFMKGLDDTGTTTAQEPTVGPGFTTTAPTSEAPLNAPPVPGAMQPIQRDPRGPLYPPQSTPQAPPSGGIIDYKDYFGQ